MNLCLNYEGFEDYLKEKKPNLNGIQYIFKFDNSFGASVIKHMGSYGHAEDLWELAVIRFYSYDVWHIDYDTDITNDVLGYLTDERVRELLQKIKEL